MALRPTHKSGKACPSGEEPLTAPRTPLRTAEDTGGRAAVAGHDASGRGGAVVPVAGAPTRLAAAIIAPHSVVAGRRRPRLVLPTKDQHMAEGSLTKAALVEEVTHIAGLTKKDAKTIVDTVFGSIVEALHTGDKVEIRGFGSFRLRRREPRKGRNPRTGDRVDVPSKRVAYFKPGKELKELINREPAQAVPPPLTE